MGRGACVESKQDKDSNGTCKSSLETSLSISHCFFFKNDSINVNGETCWHVICQSYLKLGTEAASPPLSCFLCWHKESDQQRIQLKQGSDTTVFQKGAVYQYLLFSTHQCSYCRLNHQLLFSFIYMFCDLFWTTLISVFCRTWVTVTSFTVGQTQIKLNCCIRTHSTGIGVMISTPDTGISVCASLHLYTPCYVIIYFICLNRWKIDKNLSLNKEISKNKENPSFIFFVCPKCNRWTSTFK